MNACHDRPPLNTGVTVTGLRSSYPLQETSRTQSHFLLHEYGSWRLTCHVTHLSCDPPTQPGNLPGAQPPSSHTPLGQTLHNHHQKGNTYTYLELIPYKVHGGAGSRISRAAETPEAWAVSPSLQVPGRIGWEGTMGAEVSAQHPDPHLFSH